MNENLRKFLEYASENEEVKQELDALNDNEDRDAVISGTIEVAKKAGFELSADDFAGESGELSDDELDAVAGGEMCSCLAGGVGKGDDHERFFTAVKKAVAGSCVCALQGTGETCWTNTETLVSSNEVRCSCVRTGSGNYYHK